MGNKKADLRWDTIELMGYAYYSEMGYRILVPLVKYTNYDFVVDKDGEFLRVNVKLAGLKNKNDPHSWSVSVRSTQSRIDILLIYLPWPYNMFIEVPPQKLSGLKSKAKRIPRQY